MAPFANDGPVFDQHQSGITANHGLERNFIHGAEGVFSPCQLPPAGYGLLVTGGETIERVSVCLCVFIQLVYLTEVSVAGIFQMGRDEQEGIVIIAQYLFRDILPGFH